MPETPSPEWTLVYMLAAHYGGHASGAGEIVGRLFRAPPFLAIVAALLINALAPPAADGALEVLTVAGQLIALLVVPAVGILFEARRIAAREVVAAVALRCGAGVVAGALIALTFDFDRATDGDHHRRQRRAGRLQRGRHGRA